MSSPLEIIKTGILNEDWQLVCDGYKVLTGEELASPDKPKPKRKRGRPRKNKDSTPTAPEEKVLYEGEYTSVEVVDRPKTNPWGRPVQNTFKDTQKDAEAFYKRNKKLAKEREELRDMPRQPSRPAPERVEVTCSCGRVSKIKPEFYDKTTYKCSKCL
ncbi:MAG: hypothetical protein R3213_12775, partial [Flavobacteriaceae bacterium]|nr:hypothetical protein [Flavobacteriaceae bacterium]